MTKSRFLLTACSSGAGKTTLTLALLRAYKERGIKLAPFKVGPDYIDPLWHAAAAGVPSYNLDGWLLEPPVLRALLGSSIPPGGLAIIEGVMGLYDGLGASDVASSAHVARLTDSPVVLLVDGRGMALSVAAVVKGFRDLDPRLNMGGVIVNRLSSAAHYGLIKEAVEKRVGLPVLGWLPEVPDLALESQELGLRPPQHCPSLQERLTRLANIAAQHIDLEKLRNMTASPLKGHLPLIEPVGRVRVAMARDAAFSAYDEGSLQLWRSLGAELIPFSPLEDGELPKGVQALLLCGSGTARYAVDLARNRAMCATIGSSTLPLWAEGLGAAYVGRELDGLPLCGLLEHRSFSWEKMVAFGYVETDLGRAQEYRYLGGEIAGANVWARRAGGKGNVWLCGRHEPGLHVFWPHTQAWTNPRLVRDFLSWARERGSRIHN